MGRPRGFGPRGKAASSAAISLSLEYQFSAPPHCPRRVPRSRLSELQTPIGDPGEKAERDLTRRCAVRIGDGLQQLAGLAARRRKIIVTERRIGDDGDALLLAPWDHRVLDRAFLQMIEHLVAGDLALARDRQQLVEIVGVEIADAPGADLSRTRSVPRTPRPCPSSGYEPRQCSR